MVKNRVVADVIRNVLTKVPKKLKKTVADDIRSIFYASSKQKAMGFFDIFREVAARSSIRLQMPGIPSWPLSALKWSHTGSETYRESA